MKFHAERAMYAATGGSWVELKYPNGARWGFPLLRFTSRRGKEANTESSEIPHARQDARAAFPQTQPELSFNLCTDGSGRTRPQPHSIGRRVAFPRSQVMFSQDLSSFSCAVKLTGASGYSCTSLNYFHGMNYSVFSQ